MGCPVMSFSCWPSAADGHNFVSSVTDTMLEMLRVEEEEEEEEE